MNRNPNAPSIGRRSSLAGLLLLLALSILSCLLFSHPVDTGGEARQTALLIAANGLRQGQSREDVRLFPGPEGTGVQVAHTIEASLAAAGQSWAPAPPPTDSTRTTQGKLANF